MSTKNLLRAAGVLAGSLAVVVVFSYPTLTGSSQGLTGSWLNVLSYFSAMVGYMTDYQYTNDYPDFGTQYPDGSWNSDSDQTETIDMPSTGYFVCVSTNQNPATSKATCRPDDCLPGETKFDPLGEGAETDEEICTTKAATYNNSLFYACATENGLTCELGQCSNMQDPIQGGFDQHIHCEQYLQQSSSVSTSVGTTTDQTSSDGSTQGSGTEGPYTLCR